MQHRATQKFGHHLHDLAGVEQVLDHRVAIGEVRADSYEVLDDGDRIVLKGKVWTKFMRKRNRDGTPVEPASAGVPGGDGR